MLSNHLILCRPLLLLPSIFPSIRVFSNKSALCIRWPKYWSFSFSFSPSNEYSRLISFKIDSFDLLSVQGTLKSLLQHHNSKASTLRHSEFLWFNSHICMINHEQILPQFLMQKFCAVESVNGLIKDLLSVYSSPLARIIWQDFLV